MQRCLLLFIFLQNIYTLHQFSCSHIPQQNSVAQRKHQHLLNVTRALPFQSKLPIKFFGCISTATNLINATPSLILKKKKLHLKLYFIPFLITIILRFLCVFIAKLTRFVIFSLWQLQQYWSMLQLDTYKQCIFERRLRKRCLYAFAFGLSKGWEDQLIIWFVSFTSHCMVEEKAKDKWSNKFYSIIIQHDFTLSTIDSSLFVKGTCFPFVIFWSMWTILSSPLQIKHFCNKLNLAVS